MLRKYYVLVLLVFVLLGCNFSTGTKTEETTALPADDGKPKVGDLVVAKWMGSSFYEGTIEKIENTKITIKWSDGSSSAERDEGDVYSVPKAGSKADVGVGDMVLAKISTNSYWNGAEVTKVAGEVISVKTIETAQSQDIGGDKIIKVSAVTAANLKKKGGSNEFLKDAQAKSPEIPQNYKPKAGEKVLAEWAKNSWWSGKFQKMNGNKATIAWDDGSKPSDVASDRIMPRPTAASSKTPAENQYVLVKPKVGSKWFYAKTTSINGKNIQVKDSAGNTHDVNFGDFVVLN